MLVRSRIVDPDRTGRLTGPAVDASARTVKCPEKMKGKDIRLLLSLAAPLGIVLVNETDVAIAQGAGIAAGIAADTILKGLIEAVPSVHRDSARPRGAAILVDIPAAGLLTPFRPMNSSYSTAFLWGAGDAIVSPDLSKGNTLREATPLNQNLVSFQGDPVQNLAWKSFLNLLRIHHAR